MPARRTKLLFDQRGVEIELARQSHEREVVTLAASGVRILVRSDRGARRPGATAACATDHKTDECIVPEVMDVAVSDRARGYAPAELPHPRGLAFGLLKKPCSAAPCVVVEHSAVQEQQALLVDEQLRALRTGRTPDRQSALPSPTQGWRSGPNGRYHRRRPSVMPCLAIGDLILCAAVSLIWIGIVFKPGQPEPGEPGTSS